jgi:hypothetical protein
MITDNRECIPGTGMMSSEFTKWPENVMIASPVGYADFSIWKNGTLLYVLNLAEKCRHGLRGNPIPLIHAWRAAE